MWQLQASFYLFSESICFVILYADSFFGDNIFENNILFYVEFFLKTINLLNIDVTNLI